MFTIPTYIAKSDIEGMGVFTAVPVKKGEIIWKFNPDVDQRFTSKEFRNLLGTLSKENADKLKSWVYYENNVWILCGDNAKFCNHSEDNPSSSEQEVDGEMTYCVARRDLDPGDEITCNYKSFDDNDKQVDGELYDKKRKKITNKNRKT